MGETHRTTLKDIARSLGMSVNTVSRALNGKDSVSEATRERIKAEAQRLGYVPNSLARSLVLGSPMTIGMVITNPSNPFYARLISAVEQRGRTRGYSLMLLVTEENAESDQAAAESLLRWGVDGALVVPVQNEADHWQRLRSSGIPLVLLNRDVPGLEADFVGVDYERGAYEATTHLLDAGARTVCLMEEDLPISPVEDRISGFRRAMSEHGHPTGWGRVQSVPTRRKDSSALPWEPADSHQIAREVIAGPERPDAILVGNDYFALGVYRALEESGLRVCEDVLVGGYGDHPFAPYLSPPLSTVRLPAAEIGAEAVDLLFRRIKDRNEHEARDKTRLPPQLVTRRSSVSPRDRGSSVPRGTAAP